MTVQQFVIRFVLPIIGGVVIASVLMFIGCPWASLVSNAVMALTFGINMAVEGIRSLRTRSN